MTLPSPNPRVAPLLRREARVTRYAPRPRDDTRDAFRLVKNLGALKNHINGDFRSGTLGNLMFEILEHDRVQNTQWARTLGRFLERGLE